MAAKLEDRSSLPIFADSNIDSWYNAAIGAASQSKSHGCRNGAKEDLIFDIGQSNKDKHPSDIASHWFYTVSMAKEGKSGKNAFMEL